MKVKELMVVARSLKFCNPDTKLNNAAEIMKKANCGALPVVDKSNKVVGIVTDRDIALSLGEKKKTSTVGQIMPKKIYTVHDYDDVDLAFKQMRTNRVGRLPVVDNNGKLKGIISLHGLINDSVNRGNEDLGRTKSPGENLLKTVQAITNRYSGKGHKTNTSKTSAAARALTSSSKTSTRTSRALSGSSKQAGTSRAISSSSKQPGTSRASSSSSKVSSTSRAFGTSSKPTGSRASSSSSKLSSTSRAFGASSKPAGSSRTAKSNVKATKPQATKTPKTGKKIPRAGESNSTWIATEPRIFGDSEENY